MNLFLKRFFVPILIISGYIIFWNLYSVKLFSWQSVLFPAVLIYAVISAGDIIVRCIKIDLSDWSSLYLSILFGVAGLSLFLLVGILLLPVKMNVIFYILLGFIVILKIMQKPDVINQANKNYSDYLLTIHLIIGLSIVTLWNFHTLDPFIIHGNNIIFVPFHDAFFHANEIRALANTHGYYTLQNIQLSGTAPPIYHYAQYILSSLMAMQTHIPYINSYTSFENPLGMFLLFISAYVLIEYWFGVNAAFWGSLFIMVIPDSVFQGFGNLFYGYFWLNQISPGLMYGIAVASLAWVLIFYGCSNNTFKLVVLGWIVAWINILFKFQIAWINMLLIFIYPIIYYKFKTLQAKYLLCGILALLTAFSVFMLANYANYLLPGFAKSYFTRYANLVICANFANQTVKNFCANASIIGYCVKLFSIFSYTFGVLGIGYLIFFKYFNKQCTKSALFFPLLIMLNYILVLISFPMAPRGTPEEFIHRPFVWAYFVVTSWMLGAIFNLILYRMNWYKCGLISALFMVVCFMVPLKHYKTVQIGPTWGEALTNTKVERQLVSAAQFIKSNSKNGDLILSYNFDPDFMLSALSERQDYIVKYVGAVRFNKLWMTRYGEVNVIKNNSNALNIKHFMQSKHIKFYISRIAANNSWQKMNIQRFQFGDYILYKFY